MEVSSREVEAQHSRKRERSMHKARAGIKDDRRHLQHRRRIEVHIAVWGEDKAPREALMSENER
ncbi:hypothetical protein SERLA73DRAFT_189728 [Serpula lacrymans var. lacrymans S7.3]|uniref:Uncharacterized protein n=2 Tax=Serpula lacrymans var. lacrymans TaxID=341189 RepID=F8QEH6_SERL3|nr:uncharacterized protein SERLADRAFT_480795 [Serpula lacrymans var. lacrymans S7.9]EGN93232.1 hypothetical protein SERLA73DRAFT_189728 [Serpula lacrymans var. lacrymans S7.3]EGO18617.1 hypothetical protein SERLADRAFT_480795 [Serpula lacrymans var. lacrymans S7.9]